jgi:hypothetical protein
MEVPPLSDVIDLRKSGELSFKWIVPGLEEKFKIKRLEGERAAKRNAMCRGNLNLCFVHFYYIT